MTYSIYRFKEKQRDYESQSLHIGIKIEVEFAENVEEIQKNALVR